MFWADVPGFKRFGFCNLQIHGSNLMILGARMLKWGKVILRTVKMYSLVRLASGICASLYSGMMDWKGFEMNLPLITKGGPIPVAERSTATRLLGLRVRIPVWTGMSGRDCCVGLITCPDEYYRVCCVWVWSCSLDSVEALTMGSVAPRMAWGGKLRVQCGIFLNSLKKTTKSSDCRQ